MLGGRCYVSYCLLAQYNLSRRSRSRDVFDSARIPGVSADSGVCPGQSGDYISQRRVEQYAERVVTCCSDSRSGTVRQSSHVHTPLLPAHDPSSYDYLCGCPRSANQVVDLEYFRVVCVQTAESFVGENACTVRWLRLYSNGVRRQYPWGKPHDHTSQQ